MINDKALPLKEIWQRNAAPLAATFCAGAATHFWLYANNLVNTDSLISGLDQKFARGWELSLGRWVLPIFDILCGGLNAPILIAFLALLFFSLGAVILNELFNIKGSMRILVPLCVVASPLVSNTLTYPYCSEAYACGFFLGALSVLLSAKTKSLYGAIGAILCLAVSLGTYQSNLGVTAILALCFLLFRVITQPQNLKEHGKLCLKLIITSGLGIAVYYAIMNVINRAFGISMASYKGASDVGIVATIKNLPISILRCYQDFWSFFAKSNIMVNSYLVKFCYAALFLIFFVLFAQFLIQQKNFIISCVCVTLLAVLPIACNIIDIFAPKTKIILLTSGGITLVAPALLALCAALAENIKNRLSIKKYGVYVITALLAYNYILVVNTDALVIKTRKEQTVAFANRVCMRLEEYDDYLAGDKKVLLIGNLSNGNYKLVTRLDKRANRYAKTDYIWRVHVASANGWREIFYQYLGIRPEWGSKQQSLEISNSEEFKSMPNFPAQSSIKTINDVVVVKISDMDRVDLG